MFDIAQYELLDFGGGRKLERFGEVVLDRPSPAAEGAQRADASQWKDAAARYELLDSSASEGRRGKWQLAGLAPERWTIAHGPIRLELKLTDFGHVGVFPEQAPNWDWIGRQASGAPMPLLNLFAYTGGSTLAAVASGAEVTHVDAARSAVTWARRNAELSDLSEAPVRWIVEDALKFCRREVQRGRPYDAVILDPPSYGHGPAGQAWKLEEHLPELLSVCRELTAPQAQFVLLTCHAPEYGPSRLAESLVEAGLAARRGQVEADDLWLCARDGRKLHAGAFARVGIK